MHVVFLTPELSPFTGFHPRGEMVAELGRALRELGTLVTVITPFYRGISAEGFGLARRIRTIALPVGNEMVELALMDGKLSNSDVNVIFVDHPASFNRPGRCGEDGGLYPDNHRRFYLACASVPRIVEELQLSPTIVHCVGWQSAFLPLLLRRPEGSANLLASAPLVFTLHEPDEAGLFPPAILDELRLGYDLFTPNGIEFHGRVSLLKAGVLLADRITTHSPAYARDLLTSEHGGGYHGFFAAHQERIEGVQLGVNQTIWNPATDYRLVETYDADRPEGKAACKRALQTELGLPTRAQIPLLVMPNPLEEEQGFELLYQVLPQLAPDSLQLILAGEAGAGASDRLQALTTSGHPSHVVGSLATDPDRLHRLLAGADGLLLPARREPFALLLMKAMRFGTVPLVRAAAAARDAVVDFDVRTLTGTGICFNDFSAEGLQTALRRFASVRADASAWASLMRNTMRQSFTWQQTASRYDEIYKQLLQRD